ncbi:MAG: hypothetical protein QXS81_04910 [Candidatus Micrarchaeaceae archaeon]
MENNAAQQTEDKLYRVLIEMVSAIEENPHIVETELRNTYIIKLIHNLGWADNRTRRLGKRKQIRRY